MTSAIDGATKVAAIIGDPVAHSRSPAIWNAAFSDAGLDWVFVAFPVAAGQGGVAVDAMRALGIAALTVTMPHKSDAARACDELTPTAERLGAANAVLNLDGTLCGDSTDGQGFVRSVVEEGVDLAGATSVIIGAGGAARAICQALGEASARVVVAARRPDAAATAAALAPDGRGVELARITDELRDAALVVNATPVGMQGEPPPVDVALLASDAVVVDTIYHPAETPLLAAARARGLRCIGGLGMLVHQAAISFERFTGERAPLESMRRAAAGA